MAIPKSFLTNINLNGFMLMNVRLHNLTTHPVGKEVGYLYYNSVDKKVYVLVQKPSTETLVGIGDSSFSPDGYPLGVKYFNTDDKKLYEIVSGFIWGNATAPDLVTNYIVSSVSYYFNGADLLAGTVTGLWESCTYELMDATVTNQKLSVVATNTIKGRKTAGTGVVEDLSPEDVKLILGLNKLTNDAQVKKTASATAVGNIPVWSVTTGDQLSGGYSVETVLSGSADSMPTANAVKTYIDSLLATADALVFKGTLGTSGSVQSLPTTYSAGWTYKVVTAGTYAGVACQGGELIIAVMDRADSGNLDSDWSVTETNDSGAVTSSSKLVVDRQIAVFDGTSGKIIKAVNVKIDADGNINLPLGANIYINGNPLSTNISGSVFVTNVVATNVANNVGTKVTSSDGAVLESCVSDTTLVTVSVLALTGITNYKPNVILKWGTSSQATVIMTASADKPVFTGSVAIDLGSLPMTIQAIHEDGATDYCTIGTDAAPVIQSAVFTGGYPGAQTELKSGDTFNFNVVSNIPIVSVEFDGASSYAFNAATIAVPSGTNQTVTGTIANRGTSVQSLPQRVRVKKSTGTWSAWFTTDSVGTTDGTHRIKLNNLYPSVSIGTITYPASQGALKASESATVANTVSNYDVIQYSSPISELSVSNATVYEASKSVSRVGGTYNVSSNNLRIVATRSANNAVTTVDGLVKIAAVAPTITVSVPYSRLRSGGSDGTSAQDYVVTITSSQQLYALPTLGIGSRGSWLGTAFAGTVPGTSFTRSIRILDNDSNGKGVSSWGSLSAVNLAGIEQTAINVGGSYTVGGFVARTLTLAAFANEVSMNVAATDYSKVTLLWNIKALPNQRALGTTATPDANSWCLQALASNPTIVRILDTAATGASSTPSYVTVEEAV
jgi:hypothetical protein